MKQILFSNNTENRTNKKRFYTKSILVKTSLLFMVISAFIITGCRGNKGVEADKGNGKNLSDGNTTDPGVVINGITWATRNVDTPDTFSASPESAGMFYQWNRRVGWVATGEVSGWDASYSSSLEWEEINAPCPEGWRVPTRIEMESLETQTIGGAETPCTTRNDIVGRSIISGN